MKYEQPKVVVVAKAGEIVRTSTMHKYSTSADGTPASEYPATSPAYEADE